MTSEFNVKDFCREPSLEKLVNQTISKDQWKFIAFSFDIEYASSCNKEQLKNIVIETLTSRKILPDEAIDELTPMSKTLDQSRLDVDNQSKASSDDGRNSSDWSEARLAFEREKLALEIQLQKEKLALEQEQKERDRALELQLQREKLALEQEQRDKDREIEIAKIQQLEESQKFQKEKLDLDKKHKSFNLSKSISLVPQFTESDPEKYFQTFEKTAEHLQWPKTEWTWLIRPKLEGKAATVVNNLEDISDYDLLRKAVLDAYEITPEFYRRQFRNSLKSDKQTFLDFANEKLRSLKKWLESLNVNTFPDLVNLVALEEFKRRLPFNISMYVEEKRELDLKKAAQLADAYNLIVRSHRGNSKSVKPSSGFHLDSGSGNKSANNNKPTNVSKDSFCSYCRKSGHTIKECTHPNCKSSSAYKLSQSSTKSSTLDKSVSCVGVGSPSQDIFSPFKVVGKISTSQNSETCPVTILRDTGSAQSLLCKFVLDDSNMVPKYTGRVINIKTIDSCKTAQEVEVFLQSKLLSGKVKVAVINSELPVPGVSFLLGNDLAGAGMLPELIKEEKPLTSSPTASIDKESPHIFPVCAVTRSKSEKLSPDCTSPVQENLYNQYINKENLIKAQMSDNTLAGLRHIATGTTSDGKNPCVSYKEGVLMRSYHPPNLSNSDTWSTVNQIVLPSTVRKDVIGLAHDGLAGHLGEKKTYKKILNDFFWPGMKKQVHNYVKNCHVCQVVGKPNKVIPPAPLHPIPVVSDPFEKIVVDCVGPLPKTKKGNQYLLTVMCSAIRYPEAFPLRDIKAKHIVKHLLQLFTRVGIPKILQTDQGSNFTSELMTQVMKELNVSKQISTAYRPQTQGCLERFHQTFKSMLKKFCIETSKDWDEDIDFLLFAVRECPQESLGYSPFELLYGRQIRGPLKILKETWFSDVSVHPSRTVSEYINSLKLKLSEVRSIALENMKKSQSRMKSQFDKVAKDRVFKVGDKVLLHLPLPGNPLKGKYTGPYVISQKLSNLNYVIETPDQRRHSRIIHVNQIKPYFDRNQEEGSLPNAVCVVSTHELDDSRTLNQSEEIEVPTPSGNPVNSIILNNFSNHFSTLSDSQKFDLLNLFNKFPSVTADSPGFCHSHVHDVQLVDPNIKPIKQMSYRVNPQKRDIMKKEIDYLIDQKLIEPSYSPWASPSLLVPKPDGSFRLCTDYRKLNSITVPDAFPLPRIDDIIDEIGNAKYVSTIDLQKGYYQIGLTERAKTLSSFITPFGLYQYRVMPFGMTNAPSTFQRAISQTISSLEGIMSYLDDIVVFSDTWEQHLDQLHKLWERLSSAGFTVNLAKSSFGQGTVTYLGHIVGQGLTRPKEANIEAILAYPLPTNRKSLMRFLGMCGYYRRYCPNFADVSSPLTDLTSPKKKFEWTPVCSLAFSRLKELLSTQPVLHSPDPSLPYHLQIDASDMGVGAVLLQEDPATGVLHPVSYHSAKLKKHQKGYSTIEKECLAIVSAIKKFECYLPQNSTPIFVYADHNPLAFINKMRNKNQRILRWALSLQEYRLKVQHIKGVDNRIADTLSRDLPSSIPPQ